MRNNKDLKKREPTEKDGCFVIGFIVAGFLPAYIFQLVIVLWEDNYKLSIIWYFPIVPFIIALFSFWIAGSFLLVDGAEMKILKHCGNLGAVAVGFAYWFAYVAVVAIVTFCSNAAIGLFIYLFI